MLQKGRAALFGSFGIGKTRIQCDVMRQIGLREHGRQLIVCPLGVRQEFIRDAKPIGLSLTFAKKTHDIDGDGCYLTNYESIRDGKIDVNLFNAVSLDEASVLRSYGSKTYQEFLTLFDSLTYRFVATATPSPNRYKELIHYAGFLGIMDTGQALTRFFQRDSEKANNLTLYPHMEREFFLWLHSWAIFIQKPSDLGFSDEGYALPPMRVHYHEVPVENLSGGEDRDGQMHLIRDAAMGLKDAAAEKRESIVGRARKCAEILKDNPGRHAILWHDLEAERHAIKDAIPEAVSVYGSQDLDEREQAIIDFSEGKFQYLSTKPIIAGSGCNFQRHCSLAIFVGIGYKFNDFIQACHRISRFMQKEVVDIHVIFMETEREILAELQRKWSEDTQLRSTMSDIIKSYGLSTTGFESELHRSIGVTRKVVTEELYTLAHNDCTEEAKLMDENSIDLIHTSIPFGNHYEYSASYNDYGHNPTNEQFFQQMDFLTPELLRILRPGRVAAIHVKDRIRFGNVTGYGMPTVEPFHADCIFHYKKHGFAYMGMITIVTDVVRENNQTYRLGWSEQCKDGTKMGVGSPEYVLLFRKLPTDTSRAYADMPVQKSKQEYTRARWQVDAHAFWRSSGNRFLTASDLEGLGPDMLAKLFTQRTLETIYDHAQHVEVGEQLEEGNRLPATFMAIAPGSHDPDVWTDVNRMRTLNSEQSSRNVEKHICPLQFDIVDRIITRYTNPGELVFDPFSGLGTVPYRAVLLGRRGYGSELSESYWKDSVRYVQAAVREATAPTLFDFLSADEELCAGGVSQSTIT
jgi:DNA modification methylase